MITALIVDDEEHNRTVLQTILEEHCPEINIVGDAKNVEEAFLKIKNSKPQLVFLDIKMPLKTGFDLLKRFPEINFEVIFVTGFNKYAIKAFDFNAVGYILKPIDVHKLVKTVDKARERIATTQNNDIILHFVNTLSEKDQLVNKITVHHNGKVIFINLHEISFIETKGDNTTLTLFDNTHYYSSKDLVAFENMLADRSEFVRISKNTIINLASIKSYSKGETCIIEVQTGQVFEVSRRRKSEILKLLKSS